MKRYKSLLLQIGILLLIIAGVFFILEQRKQFLNIDFSKHYSQNKTIELSGFEEGEQWQGNYTYDTGRVLEGKTSITLSSWYGKENTINNTVGVAIPISYTNGYLSLYVKDANAHSAIERIALKLSGEDGQEKIYNLLPDITSGWNRVALSIPAWKKISVVSFTIQSKPGEIAEVNLDRLWIENTSSYTSDIFSSHNIFTSLRTIGSRTYLFSSSPQPQQLTLITPPSIQKGYIILSLLPEHAQLLQLSLNNTTLQLTGEKRSECALSAHGRMALISLKSIASIDNQYLFIKADVQGENVKYSLSNNGIDYETCGNVVGKGRTPLVLSLQGSYLIDAVSAEY